MTRVSLRALLAVVALVLAAAVPAVASAAEPPRIENLRVEGGEAAWHAEEVFRLDWDQVPGPPAEPRAVVYRLYDLNGKSLGDPVRDTEEVRTVERLRVPSVPGIYTAEVWLENSEGQAGPAAMAKLRFDNAAPPAPFPQAPQGWLAGNETAMLGVDPPASPLPISGLRGYAVSLDRGGGSSPCASPKWCSPEETDLAAGIGAINLGTLPEGTNFARVAAVSGAGVPSPLATAVFKVDSTYPELSLLGLPNGWSDGPVQLTAIATDRLSGMAAAGPSGPLTAIGVDGGGFTTVFGAAASTVVTGSGVHRVEYYARDAAGNVADGELGAPPPATATVRIDEEAPRVAFAAGQDPSEPERIEATVSDELSGPSPHRGSIAVRPAGTGARFEELPTIVAPGRLVAHWDSDAYPPGKYEFLATGFDLAGNPGRGSERERGGRMVLVNPLKAPLALESGFLGKGRGWQDEKRVRLGRGVRFGGKLQTLWGASVGGVEVAVTETFAAGASPARRTTFARTRGDGTFSVRLAPGPSRDVTASFAGNRAFTKAASDGAHLAVRAALRFRASATTARIGGAPVVFSGKVANAGAEQADHGLPVELQFRYRGSGWREFRTVETDARGRFRYAYRFSDDDSRGVRFQFRAYIKGREGWPFEPGSSRPVSVTGR
jgi:hypothetical protein